MAATQYVGAHYVPHGWEEWNPNTYYDGLFCVSYNYSWFIAKQNVPVGISPVNTEYWAPYSLTTGAQQELVDLVSRYDPKTAIPPNTNFDTILGPGTYFLNSNSNYINAPFNNNNGSMTVKKISERSEAVIQRVESAGDYPSTYQRQVGGGYSTQWFIMENPKLLDYYNFEGDWLNNVDVFETIGNYSPARVFKFGINCTNAPINSQHFYVEVRNNIAVAYGTSEKSLAIARRNSTGWEDWVLFPNANFFYRVATNNMMVEPVKDSKNNYHFYYKKDSGTIRFSGLLLINESNGNGALVFLENNGSTLTKTKLAGSLDPLPAIQMLINEEGIHEILVSSGGLYDSIRLITSNNNIGFEYSGNYPNLFGSYRLWT